MSNDKHSFWSEKDIDNSHDLSQLNEMVHLTVDKEGEFSIALGNEPEGIIIATLPPLVEMVDVLCGDSTTIPSELLFNERDFSLITRMAQSLSYDESILGDYMHVAQRTKNSRRWEKCSVAAKSVVYYCCKHQDPSLIQRIAFSDNDFKLIK